MLDCRSRIRRRENSLSSARPAPDSDEELALEQGYVTGLHRRLDDIRAQVVGRLDDALAMTAHNPQAVGEREATVQLYTERLVALDAAESGLCFGRLDRRGRPPPPPPRPGGAAAPGGGP